MNVDDIEKPEEYPPCLMVAMMEHQMGLIEKYHPIEEKNGLLLAPEVPVEMDSPAGQLRLKDFAWRVTEELTEMTVAFREHNYEISNHVIEEYADSLHFMIELVLLSGVGPRTIDVTRDGNGCLVEHWVKRFNEGEIPKNVPPMIMAYRVIEQLGEAMNCLKNKPWKQTHFATDIHRYLSKVLQAQVSLIELGVLLGLDAKGIYDAYFRKNKVNQFRIDSKY